MIRPRHEARGGERLPVAAEPVAAPGEMKRVVAQIPDEADPAVAEAQQELGGCPAAAGVVDDDAWK